MSRKNYGNYSKQNQSEKTEQSSFEREDQLVESEPAQLVDDVVGESEDTNQEYLKTTEQVETVYGIVNCGRLNVRNKPNKESPVLTVLDRTDKVVILSSYDEWVEVLPTSGVRGYCMKEFLTIE